MKWQDILAAGNGGRLVKVGLILALALATAVGAQQAADALREVVCKHSVSLSRTQPFPQVLACEK